MDIRIYPLEKVVIDGVPICLGAEHSAVETTIGKGQFVRDRYYYYDSELSICYDSFGKVNFIEFLGSVDGNLKPIIYNVSVFDADAEEIFELLKHHNGNEIIDSEQGHCYSFLNLSVGIYRESTSKIVSDMLTEAKSFGKPMNHDDIEYEMKRANHWASIGIGIAGYYLC